MPLNVIGLSPSCACAVNEHDDAAASGAAAAALIAAVSAAALTTCTPLVIVQLVMIEFDLDV
jgi:hypothetical protein